MKKSTLKFAASREKFESTILNSAEEIICLSMYVCQTSSSSMLRTFVKANFIYHGFYACTLDGHKVLFVCTNSPEFLKSLQTA